MTTKGRLPNFLYIGPDKAGSTWLHETLVQHPEVFLSPAKDLYYFDRYYGRGVEWYSRHFTEAGSQVVVGEICQDYLADPVAPDRIRDTLGAPFLMVTLRDPVHRAFSSYLYMRKHGEGPPTFREALRTEPNLLDHGRYGTQIERYRARFPAEKIHIAVFDDLKTDPQEFLNHVLAFLGLSPMPLSREQLTSKLPASRARVLPIAWAVRRAANIARAHDGAALVGRVKRSPNIQRLLYAPLGDGAPSVEPLDAAWIRDQLRHEIRMVDDHYSLGLQNRWGW